MATNGAEESVIRDKLLECVRTLHYSTDANTSINDILEIIGNFYEANRAYIFEYDEDHEYSSNTYEWCREGISSEKDKLQNIPLSQIGRWEKLFDSHGVVSISKLDHEIDNDSIEYMVLSAQGIESLLTVSIDIDDKRVGFIGVDDPRKFSDDTILLQSVAYIISDDLQKRKLENDSSSQAMINQLDYLKAGIVIGRFEGSAGSFTAVNKYFCEQLGLSREELLGRRESGDIEDGRTNPGLLEAIHPDDLNKVFTYFMGLCQGEGKEGSLVFRIKTVTDPAGQYFNCQSRTVLQHDGSYTIYSVYTDASVQQHQREEFDKLMQNLLVTNPHSRCAYHLNLTKNLCTDCHGATEFIQHIIDASSADELIGKAGMIILDAKVRDDYIANCTREKLIERCLNGEKKFSLTYRRKTEGKQYLWVETFYHLMQNPSTSDIEAIAYTVDVDHEMKESLIISQLAEKEFYAYGTIDINSHRFEHYYLNGQPVNEKGKIVTIETEIEKMSEHIGNENEVNDFILHSSLPYVLKKLSKKDVYTYSFTMDGKRMQTTYRYLDERKDYLSFIISDVTGTVARQQETMQVLREALSAAENANNAKTDFLSRMSHDIRTPMNAIIGFSNLILQNPDDSEKVRDEASKILSSGNHLLGLINDVLDMSKIESGNVQLNQKSFELEQCLKTVEGIIRPQMEAKNQTFDIKVSGVKNKSFIADDQRLQQVLINILSNSTKYTPEGGKIDFEVSGVREKAGKFEVLAFTITDNGIGMSEEYQKFLFEPFSREVNDSVNSEQGTGLGMAITKNLVNMMGGSITVDSKLGIGSSFRVIIPLQADTDNAVGGEKNLQDSNGDSAKEVSIEGLNILAAEDNELNTEILVEVLKQNGCRADTVVNGLLAADTFYKAPVGFYDLIILDIQMPVMTGYQAAERIRSFGDDSTLSYEKRQEASSIPIIAMTANAFSDDVQKAMDSGMNAHVAKPINIELLKETIAGLLDK